MNIRINLNNVNNSGKSCEINYDGSATVALKDKEGGTISTRQFDRFEDAQAFALNNGQETAQAELIAEKICQSSNKANETHEQEVDCHTVNEAPDAPICWGGITKQSDKANRKESSRKPSLSQMLRNISLRSNHTDSRRKEKPVENWLEK